MAKPWDAPDAGALCVCSKIGMFWITINSVGVPSKATPRGEAMVLVSVSVFKKESTACRPSALRKAVAGLIPLEVLAVKPPPALVEPRILVVRLVTLLEMRVFTGEAPEPLMGAPPGETVPVEAPELELAVEALTEVPDVKPLPKLTC